MNINSLSTKNKNPNITLVLPGPCQAKCSFCNWKQDDKIGKFIINLEKLLNNLPGNFRQISISGGEPTLSPVFADVIEMLGNAKVLGKIDKVVLTTNGINLNFYYCSLMANVVDHINISRHHYADDVNAKVFNTTDIPDTTDLKMIISNCNKNGIDVNFNCVFNKYNKDFNLFELQSFVGMAKSVGASSIAFRNQYDNFEPSKVQSELEQTHIHKSEQSCPVCFTKVFMVNGMAIKFHHSSYEPTENKAFDENETYELILHGNGTLARDWDGKKEISLELEVKTKPPKEVKDTKTYSSCTAEKILKDKPAKVNYSSCGYSGYGSCGN